MEEWTNAEGVRLHYTRTDYEQITRSLGRFKAAADAAAAALADGDVEKAVAAIDEAHAVKAEIAALFPPLIVDESLDPLAFAQIYPDLYHVDLLLIVTFQWPDSSPLPLTQLKELVDAFADSLGNLRQLRARPWAGGQGREEGLAALDGLISKTEELRVALATLPPGSRLDPRKYTWLGQDYKAQFLNGVSGGVETGTMYTFLFSLHHAIHRARWSLAHGKKPGAARRLIEANRVHGLFLDWMRENAPPA